LEGGGGFERGHIAEGEQIGDGEAGKRHALLAELLGEVASEDLGVALIGGAASVRGVDDGDAEVSGEVGLGEAGEGGGVEASLAGVIDLGAVAVGVGEVRSLDGGARGVLWRGGDALSGERQEQRRGDEGAEQRRHGRTSG
jgi:hypothetical protein